MASASGDVVVHRYTNPRWLPQGSSAEVVRTPRAPGPMALVRLLVCAGDRAFCVPRAGTGALDLPTRVVAASDADGTATIAALALDVLEHAEGVSFVGLVRNIVPRPDADYDWPTPVACFGVWTAKGAPIVDGEWLPLRDPSPLLGKHWFPLVAAS